MLQQNKIKSHKTITIQMDDKLNTYQQGKNNIRFLWNNNYDCDYEMAILKDDIIVLLS